MNRSTKKALQREQYGVATIETGIPKGNETAESERQRMARWLKKKGEPNFSFWRRTKR